MLLQEVLLFSLGCNQLSLNRGLSCTMITLLQKNNKVRFGYCPQLKSQRRALLKALQMGNFNFPYCMALLPQNNIAIDES
ncbi:hypothetical protein T10_1811 [Trichinella papuae]|uniref:Uncharacterized protein n=1 Tax=Trichinella papuae TaxID=268474 RepID=A0A0V1MBX7_9BILA|nr:hypothetical protein T10_1811 [Trichinella papuae]